MGGVFSVHFSGMLRVCDLLKACSISVFQLLKRMSSLLGKGGVGEVLNDLSQHVCMIMLLASSQLTLSLF